MLELPLSAMGMTGEERQAAPQVPQGAVRWQLDIEVWSAGEKPVPESKLGVVSTDTI